MERPMIGGSDRLATGWRHLYTWARGGSLGAPGFQTVARSKALDDRRLRALERAVSGLRPPTDRPCLVLQPSPSDEGRSVLTRSVPTGRSDDGRPGGFLADSVVVPDAWLSAAGWNLEAAFRAVPWGAADSLDQADGGDGGPALLPDEELPAPPAAGAAEIRAALARLDRLLPDPELRAALFQTLYWQAESAGPGETIHVVAAPEMPPEDFEALLLLLPLALPAAERVRAVEGRPGESRSLRLGTSAAPGSLEAPDLLGVPYALLEEARRAPGLVFDLAQSVPWPYPGDDRTRERARRASRDLGREPETIDEGSDEPSMRDDVTNDEDLLPDLGAGTASEAGSVPDPLAERAAAWRLRESTEAEASTLLSRLREDHQRLLEPLRRLVEGERRRFQTDLDGMKRELAEIAKQAREELAREETRQEKLLGEDVERRVKELRKSYESAADRLDDLHRDLRERLSEREAEAEDRLRQASGIPAPASSRKDRRDRLERERPERERPPVEPARPDVFRSSGPREGFWERVRSAPTGYQVAVLVALLVVIGAGGWWWSTRSGEGETTAAGTNRPEEAPGAEVAPGADVGTASELRSSAVERLRRGSVAAAVLAAAAGSESETVRDRAAAAHLALLLGDTDGAAGLDETTSCALLQQILVDRRAAVGLAPIAVDGLCGGGGTQGALTAAIAATRCSGASWQERSACVMNREISEGEPPCAASWPFRRPCGWSAGEAEAALRRVRRMPSALGRALDLAADPAGASRVSARTLDPAEAGSLLPLAWAVAEEEDGGTVASVPAAGTLDERRVETAARYLGGLSER
jgi:hypothetical protein